MSKKLEELRKPFLLWVMVNLLGFSGLGVILLVLSVIKSIPGIVPTALIISLPFSFMQWIALRRIFSISSLWILTVPIGLLLAGSIFRVIPEGLWQIVDDESTAVLTAFYLVLGLAIGLPQWLILRRQFAGSSIWLLGSSMGVAVGFWLVLVTGLINQSEFISYIVVVLVYAVITGLVLVRMLASHNRPQKLVLNTALPLTGE